LYQQFQVGYNDCPSAQHVEQVEQHIKAIGDDHHSLNNIFNDPNFPLVLMSFDFLSTDRLD
jgi:hypothetical protein